MPSKHHQDRRLRINAEAKVRVITQELKAEQLTVKADTDKLMAQINANTRLKSAKLIADADLFAAGLAAKGELLEKEEMAEGDRLKVCRRDCWLRL